MDRQAFLQREDDDPSQDAFLAVAARLGGKLTTFRPPAAWRDLAASAILRKSSFDTFAIASRMA